MLSIWAESVSRSLEEALDLLAAVIKDCSDELWQASMWPVSPPDADVEVLGPGGAAVSDAAERGTLAQRRSTPWAVAWHALECVDYDLSGEFGPWAPPSPFIGHPHWRDVTSVPPCFRAEILAYLEYCRNQIRDALVSMTDEEGARLLPPAHRYRGQPHAWVITGFIAHTTEHAAQIRQFMTAAGIAADRGR